MNLRLVAVLGVVLGFADIAPAGWGKGGCAVAQTVARAEVVADGWHARYDCPHIFGLIVDGQQVASYNARIRIFRSYDADTDTWGPPQRPAWAAKAKSKQRAAACRTNCQCEECEDGCDCRRGTACGDGRCACLVRAKNQALADCDCGCGCGAECPCAERGPCAAGCACQPTRRNVQARQDGVRDCPWAEADGTMNYGMDRSKLRAGNSAERYQLNGVAVSPDRAAFALVGADVPADGSLMRLTVIGSDAGRKVVLDDLAKMPEKDKVLVQDYAPDHWAVKGAGFFTGGNPTIYLQAPSGKVLHRVDAYDREFGARDLAQAIRKADPNYDPKKDKDLNAPSLTADIPPEALLGLGLSGAVLAGAFVLRRKL